MKIGLVRHFPVTVLNNKRYMNSQEFVKWCDEYEASGAKKDFSAEVLNDWIRCICSSSQRAIETANHLYGPKSVKSDFLKEVPLSPIFTTSLRLPLFFWLLTSRVAWSLAYPSQTEVRSETITRAQDLIVKLLENDTDVLVISHGFFMRVLQQELCKQGFKGKRFQKAEHGKLYVYERR